MAFKNMGNTLMKFHKYLTPFGDPKSAFDTNTYGWVTHKCMYQIDKSLSLAQNTHPN